MDDMSVGSHPGVSLLKQWNGAACGRGTGLTFLPEIQRLENYTMRCDNCGQADATKRCTKCKSAYYCDRGCQQKHWKSSHKKKCGTGAEAEHGQTFHPKSKKGTWSSGCALDDSEDSRCPMCLDNQDNANIGSQSSTMCIACGQMVCGECSPEMCKELKACIMCRATTVLTDEECFNGYWKLVHDRAEGRHTPRAMMGIGNAYLNGAGVAQSDSSAAAWFLRAAGEGHVGAAYNLGVCYDNGRGVAESRRDAVKWHRISAAAGYPESQYNLGCAHYTGEGAERDQAETVRWFELAAEAGHTQAAFNVGLFYAHGEGVAQDIAASLKWCQIAADGGHRQALQNLETARARGMM